MRRNPIRIDLAALCLAVLCLVGAAAVCYGGALPDEDNPLPKNLPILMYHHVVEEGPCNEMTVTSEKLEQDLFWLAEHGYQTILPQDLTKGEPLPEKPVLLTFDDGYRSNYELLFPLLQKHHMKAAISIIVCRTDGGQNITWEMCREMVRSGLVEIGSHTDQLHNFGDLGGCFDPKCPNGIQRRAGESDQDFRTRVLEDIQRSYDRIQTELGTQVNLFAYPFGVVEPDAEALIETLFPVSVVTKAGTAHPRRGLHQLPRFTVTMDTKLEKLLG